MWAPGAKKVKERARASERLVAGYAVRQGQAAAHVHTYAGGDVASEHAAIGTPAELWRWLRQLAGSRRLLVYMPRASVAVRPWLPLMRQVGHVHWVLGRGGELLQAQARRRAGQRWRVAMELRSLWGLLRCSVADAAQLVGSSASTVADAAAVCAHVPQWLCTQLRERLGMAATPWGLPLTASGLAMQLLRHQLRRRWPWLLPHTEGGRRVHGRLWLPRTQDEMAAAWYFGGRCEVLRWRLDGPAYQLDLRAAYPSTMATMAAPVPPYKKVDVWDQGQHCFLGRFAVDESAAEVPLVPERAGDRVLYLRRRKVAWLHAAEVRYLLQRGTPVRFMGPAYYTTTYLPLFTYMQELYAWRQAHAGHPWATVLKLVMNSTYGRLGMHWSRTRVRWAAELSVAEQNRLLSAGACPEWCPQLGVWVWEEEHTPRRQAVNRWVAAMITSHLRLRLLQLIDTVQAAGGQVAYVDTDSLLVDAAGYRELCRQGLVGPAMGQLQVEGVGELGAVCLAPKLYCLRSGRGPRHLRAAGVPRPDPARVAAYIGGSGVPDTRLAPLSHVLRGLPDRRLEVAVACRTPRGGRRLLPDGRTEAWRDPDETQDPYAWQLALSAMQEAVAPR